MIFDVWMGVFLGIISAKIVEKYWRETLALLLFVAPILVVIILIIVYGYDFVIDNKEEIIKSAPPVLFLLFSVCSAFWLHKKIIQKFPIIDAISKGDAPFDKVSKLPIRIVVTAMLIFSLVLLALSPLFLLK